MYTASNVCLGGQWDHIDSGQDGEAGTESAVSGCTSQMTHCLEHVCLYGNVSSVLCCEMTGEQAREKEEKCTPLEVQHAATVQSVQGHQGSRFMRTFVNAGLHDDDNRFKSCSRERRARHSR